MLVDVVMPQMGESITEGTILEWKKQVGDQVARDETLLEIGTDKVDSEIPSPSSGKLVEILAQPNQVVPVGLPIARIEAEAVRAAEAPQVGAPPEAVPAVVPPPAESPPEEVSAPSKAVPAKEATPTEAISPETAPPAISPQPVRDRKAGEGKVPITAGWKVAEKKFYTPVVRRMAQEAGLSAAELRTVPGTGRSGRVTKKDLLAYLERGRVAPPVLEGPPLPGERVEMGHRRKLIAEHMRQSLDTAAHVHVLSEVDMSPIVEYIQARGATFQQREGFPLTYTPFIILATVKALQAFPKMNASLEGTTIAFHRHINIGLAVAVEKGLMVPVIPRCEELNFLGLCRQVQDLARRTREGQISPDELQGATFSITNFGVFNVTLGTPIINQPNVGILGVGVITKRPVVIESSAGDSVGIRSMLFLSLGFDHRLIDGAEGSRFIESVREKLEMMDLAALL